MIHRLIFIFILGIDALILFSQTSHVSISSAEATFLYEETSFLQILTHASISFFGQNDFALRFVMIVLHIMSVVLMYLLSKRYIKLERNRLWLLLTFVLLPGVVSSAIVVSSAGLIIFGLLLYMYLSEKVPQYLLNSILFLYACIEVGFVYLFLGLAIYYLINKNRTLFFYNLALYFFSSFLYGFDAMGYPRGHFLDTIGIYSAIFTPIIFIYLFYTLYRRYLTNRTDMLWYVSTTALLFSLLLSFRQSVHIENFAPYLIIALPLAAQTFISSYRVRLREYRNKYRAIFVISFILLFINTLAVFFNKDLYLFIDDPKKHFAYEMHIAKELAQKLKIQDIQCVSADENMQKRLRFYNIGACERYLLKELDVKDKHTENVTISYKNKILYQARVTKINSK